MQTQWQSLGEQRNRSWDANRKRIDAKTLFSFSRPNSLSSSWFRGSLRNRLHYPHLASSRCAAFNPFLLSLLSLSFVFTALLRLLFARWINLSLLSKKLLTLRFIADPFGKYEQDGGRVGSRPSGVAASRASVKGERQRVPPSLPPPSLECSSRDGKRRFRRRSERERAG